MILLAVFNNVFFFFFLQIQVPLILSCWQLWWTRKRGSTIALAFRIEKKIHYELSPWIQMASHSNWNDFHGCNNNVYWSPRAARARSSRKSMTEINTDKRHCCLGSSLNHIWVYNTMPIHFRSAPPWSPGWYGADRTKTFKCIPAVRIFWDNKYRIRDPVGAAP